MARSDALRTRPEVTRLIHIRELDGLRGIAALMVFLYHVCGTSVRVEQVPRSLLWLYRSSSLGAHGVDLFFVLSGFLITSILIDARDKPAYYHNFYWKRALRILPIYILCLLYVYYAIPNSGKYVLISALFISNFAYPLHIIIHGPFWTLSIEEQFYLLWPTALRRLSIAQIAWMAAVVTAGAVVLRTTASFLAYDSYDVTFLRCDGLGAGALLACWYARRGDGRINRSRETWFIAGGLVLGSVLLFANGVGERAIQSHGVANARQTGVTVLCVSMVGLAIAHAGNRKMAILRSPLFTFFGLISYALYMFHLYIMDAYDQHFGPGGAGLSNFAIRFCAILGLTILLCVVSRYAIELPCMSLRRFVLAKPLPSLSEGSV
jgi:peptidoglycan/LPS O-acetylase OafA/YrhL